MKTSLEQGIAEASLEEVLAHGIEDFCIAPGGRNAALIALLKREPAAHCLYFNDERCAVFYAIGKSRRTGKPVAVVVTSGTAVAQLLAGAMEAYYTGVPLVLITADRPKRFRGKNAPQSCEQAGIFGQYALLVDVEEGDSVSLDAWNKRCPIHLNVCLEEPKDDKLAKESLLRWKLKEWQAPQFAVAATASALDHFLEQTQYPFVTVGTLRPGVREATVQFLLKLGAPVYLEGISGLREEPRLKNLSISIVDKLFQRAKAADYPIDAILRIGGVPTPRFWRDLEEMEEHIPVFSLNEEPFAGLSWGSIHCVPLKAFFESYSYVSSFPIENWKRSDNASHKQLEHLFRDQPQAEPSLIHALSQLIPETSTIFLGQSLPIRNWDLAASRTMHHANVFASRGLNGIDGQLSTFFGFCQPGGENWAILGDLTAIHDLGGWWILPQLEEANVRLVIVNNGGGKIFSRMFSDKEIQNCHSLHFESLAKFWGLAYARWEKVPLNYPPASKMIIELCPDEQATGQFWKQMP